eukprot:c11923_g2_i1 orf=2-193(-)
MLLLEFQEIFPQEANSVSKLGGISIGEGLLHTRVFYYNLGPSIEVRTIALLDQFEVAYPLISLK